MGVSNLITRSDYGSSNDDPNLMIQTKSGKMRGVYINDHVKAWLGIPYAEPPIGKFENYI